MEEEAGARSPDDTGLGCLRVLVNFSAVRFGWSEVGPAGTQNNITGYLSALCAIRFRAAGTPPPMTTTSVGCDGSKVVSGSPFPSIFTRVTASCH